jgi:tRNA dimethylallyltransferase
VGKSAVAMALAERLGGEIISVDSMQVYRGLDIGTAKPSAAERARVPHHLIDLVGLEESFSAAAFVARAREAFADILQRGRLPIFCGGTGLYFKAWFDGLGDSPAPDPALRRQVEALPLPELLRELEAGDPSAFRTIDRANPRRVIRAIEILRLAGRGPSTLRASWSRAPDPGSPTHAWIVGLTRTTGELRQRIERRVDAMFAAGLIAETRRLLTLGLERNPVALQAIGYRQVVEHLRHQCTAAEALDRVKSKTRQLAKRQLTWLRHQLPVRWWSVGPQESAELVATRIADLFLASELHQERT